MKPYAEYQDSGIEWLGRIPEQWKVKKLKYLSDVILGKMLTPNSKVGYHLKPYLRAKNLTWLKVDTIDIKEMWFSENDLKRYRLRKNDLLVSEGGEVGRTCIWCDEIPECYIQNSVNRVRFSKNLNPRYYLYLFLIYGYKGHFDSVVSRVSIAHLTKEKLVDIAFLVPPLHEQEQIAKYLDRKTEQIDTLIDKKKRLIELLKEERTAIINQAVTKGIDPDVTTKDSGIEWLGEIPAYWELSQFSRHIRTKARLGWKGLRADEYVNFGYGFLSTPNIKDKEIDFENINYITDERYTESPEIMLQKDDILLAKDGSTLGIVNIVKDLPFPCTVNSSIAVLRVISDRLIPDFLKIFIESHYLQNIIQRIKGGMGVPHLFQADINKFLLVMPPIHEQLSIVEYVEKETSRTDTIISKSEKEVELLQEYRTALISEVVTGKIDVREEKI